MHLSPTSKLGYLSFNDYNQADEIKAIRNVEIVNSMFNFRGRTISLHHKCFYSCI